MSEVHTRRDVIAMLAACACAPLASIGLSGCERVAQPLPATGKISFTDTGNYTITLDRPVERIVTMAVHSAPFAIAAQGTAKRIVGIHPGARKMFERGFIARLYPEVLQLPTDIVVGGSYVPNVESIARLAPDLVIQSAASGEDLVAPLKNMGLAVARWKMMPGGPAETVRTLLTMFGKMIGDTTRSDNIISFVDRTFAATAQTLTRVPKQDRVRAMMMMVAGDAVSASGGDASGAGYLINMAGGLNVASGLNSVAPVSAEQIALWNPEIIFVLGDPAETLAKIRSSPILSATTAAAERRVYNFPVGSHGWGAMGPEDVLAQRWMAELMYPHLFGRGLRATMKQAYKVMFDHDFSDDELNDVLLLSTNGSSAHYARFDSE